MRDSKQQRSGAGALIADLELVFFFFFFFWGGGGGWGGFFGLGLGGCVCREMADIFMVQPIFAGFFLLRSL